MKVLILILCGFSTISVFSENRQQPDKKPNILFIAVDDLKPWVTAYGDKHSKTPGMDKLAKGGIVFKNAYCQQSVCAASRASIMTGMRPDKTRVWDLVTDFRQVNPNVVTIPQYFKSMGYETAGMGKIYHMGSTGPGHDAPSWSIPYRDAKAEKWVLPYTPSKKGRGPAVECTDVPDETYHDGKLTGMAIELMDSLSKNQKPFFLAVGFLKPHLPFVAPKKYWDLYDRDEFKLAEFQNKVLNTPDFAYQGGGELKNYAEVPDFDSYSENEKEHLTDSQQKELIHGYYAATSYTDAQVLQLLNELDRLGIRENTIIVLWGDHGWHLGDHGLWGKHTNFEQSNHSPLIMSIPGKNTRIDPTTQCEFVDVFPTLCELTGTPTPNWLDGISLVPAIKTPDTELRDYALSQYPKSNGIMGYTIRTKRFRYTEWLGNNYTTNMPYDKKYLVAREIYDYQNDYLETENIVDNPKYRKEQVELEKQFLECMKREFKSCSAYTKIADYKIPLDSSIKHED